MNPEVALVSMCGRVFAALCDEMLDQTLTDVLDGHPLDYRRCCHFSRQLAEPRFGHGSSQPFPRAGLAGSAASLRVTGRPLTRHWPYQALRFSKMLPVPYWRLALRLATMRGMSSGAMCPFIRRVLALVHLHGHSPSTNGRSQRVVPSERGVTELGATGESGTRPELALPTLQIDPHRSSSPHGKRHERPWYERFADPAAGPRCLPTAHNRAHPTWRPHNLVFGRRSSVLGCWRQPDVAEDCVADTAVYRPVDVGEYLHDRVHPPHRPPPPVRGDRVLSQRVEQLRAAIAVQAEARGAYPASR